MITIDATNKKLGRVASEAAAHIMGKNDPSFVRNAISGDKVEIINASKVDISEKKKDEKKYSQYSGYPGGLRFETLRKVIEEKGYEEVFMRAIKRMLPDNRLRKDTLKNVTITE